jgi:energy-coupling factor transporter ATP-binding protein EcfA2
MHVKIRKLDMAQLKPHRIFLLVGRRGSGKTVLLRHLLHHMRERFDFCLGISPTEESASMLRQHLPESCVYTKYCQSKVDALVHCAAELVAQGRERRFLLVLDDCLYDRAITRTESFRYLFYNGRHSKITCILLSQYVLDLSPPLRAQVDYVAVQRENSLANQMKLYKAFFGIFPSFEDFAAVLDRCTQDYETLVLDNTVPSSITNCVFWAKASLDNGPFRLGKPLFYELEQAHRRASPQCEEPEPAARGKQRLVVSKEDNDDSVR